MIASYGKCCKGIKRESGTGVCIKSDLGGCLQYISGDLENRKGLSTWRIEEAFQAEEGGIRKYPEGRKQLVTVKGLVEINKDQSKDNKQRPFIQSWPWQGSQPCSLTFWQRLGGKAISYPCLGCLGLTTAGLLFIFPGSVVRESGLTSHQSDLDSRLASGAGYCRLWVRALFLYTVWLLDHFASH